MNNKEKYLKTLKLMNSSLYALYLLQKITELKKKRIRSCSVREINRDRKKNGFFVQSFLVIKDIDHQQFFIYTRMTPQDYELLVELVKPFLEKCSRRESVQPECRLAVTLMHLSQGTSFQSLAHSFKLGKETVRRIVLETTEVLCSTLSNQYLSEPNEKDYKQIAEDFWKLCHMPNCIGAIDGKHIALQCPPSSGIKFSSIVLLAACDARYQFTHIDIGAYGSQSDGGIFQQSRLGKRLLNVSNKLPIPPPENLPNSQLRIPHYFVADAAFPLAINLMRPYPNKQLSTAKDVFNQRLSKARRTIDNAFGILVSRWRVLLTTLHLAPENAEKIVLACVTLHNFIMSNNASCYMPAKYVDWEDSKGDLYVGTWRGDIEHDIPSITPSANSHHYGRKSSTAIRNNLCSFFSNV